MHGHDQLSALDATFLELEQSDDSALMHIGGALVFDPLPGGGTPALAELRSHLAERLDHLPRYRQRLDVPRTAGLSWPSWERRRAFRHRRPRPPRDPPGAGGRARFPGLDVGLLLPPSGPLPPAVGDGAARRYGRRPLGAGVEDPSLPGRRRRLGQHRRPAARRRAGAARAADAWRRHRAGCGRLGADPARTAAASARVRAPDGWCRPGGRPRRRARPDASARGVRALTGRDRPARP